MNVVDFRSYLTHPKCSRSWMEKEQATLVDAFRRGSSAQCPVCSGSVGVLLDRRGDVQRALFKCGTCGNAAIVVLW